MSVIFFFCIKASGNHRGRFFFYLFFILFYFFTHSGYWDTDIFSKLTHLGMPYLGMKPGHWTNFQKLHIYSLCTQGVEIELIFAFTTAVCEIQADFQTCNLAIGKKFVPQVACIHSLYSTGSKMTLLWFHEQQFPYGTVEAFKYGFL